MRKFIVAVVLVGLASVGYAQEGRRGGGPAGGGRAGGAPYVRLNVESAETVKGAPYAAEIINESTQTLSDGNRIVRRSTSRVYRDAEGRTRREEDRPSGSPAVTISDPVAGTFFTLDADSRTASQSPSRPKVFGGTVNRTGELEYLNVLINGQLAVFTAPNGSALVAGRVNGSVEDKLAPRTIEGVRVEGIRRTMTIAAGTIGNERPIVVTSEEWTSPELKVLVLSESNDPRSGTSTYKLVNLRRGDQPASLFQVPADYTVTQAPALGGRGEGRGDGLGGGAGTGLRGRGGAPQR